MREVAYLSLIFTQMCASISLSTHFFISTFLCPHIYLSTHFFIYAFLRLQFPCLCISLSLEIFVRKPSSPQIFVCKSLCTVCTVFMSSKSVHAENCVCLRKQLCRCYFNRLEILILYSQKFCRAKVPSSEKWRNGPLFWPCWQPWSCLPGPWPWLPWQGPLVALTHPPVDLTHPSAPDSVPQSWPHPMALLLSPSPWSSPQPFSLSPPVGPWSCPLGPWP